MLPPVSIPLAVSVVPSPTWVYIEIKTWNMPVIAPTSVIITGAIPTTFPWAPPPAIPEKQIYLNVRNNIDIARIGDHYHLRRCLEYNEWWQGNANSNIYLRYRWKRDHN